jgi:23S rRNA (uracil747-C5)-methyltransferase
VQCDYFDAGRCRSCTLMGVPYAAQLTEKDAAVRALLAERAPAEAWSEPFRGPESAFRNKAKLVVGGTRGAPVLGILDGDGGVQDLTACGLYEPGLREAVLALPDLVARTGLTPYDVATRNGELKNVIVTHSPDDELMLRFVLRSPGQLVRLREALPTVAEALPGTRVVTANLLPEHKAVLEGEVEHVLTDHDTLPMRLGGLTLHLRPQSFFQTNTTVAAGLYRQAQEWLDDIAPRTLWDLYCGVGGFALHALTAQRPPEHVTGIEVSAEAVESARSSVADLAGRTPEGAADFRSGDAVAFAQEPGRAAPEAVVVNPPRRGIGSGLAGWLEESAVRHVLYSSCNARSLAADLAAMPSLRVRRARLFDMFPQTGHHEVLVLLERS